MNTNNHNLKYLFSIASNDTNLPKHVNQINQQKIISINKFPIFSSIILCFIILGCIFADFIVNHNPFIFYLQNLNQSPNSNFYFGTDNLGRDIFSIIWYGGRISLLIGILGTIFLSTIGIIYGCISGLSPKLIDNLMMRFAELLSSIPSILLLICLTAIFQEKNILTLSISIGLVNWMSLARIVRSEVLHIKNTEYFWSAKLIGVSFTSLIFKYLLPNIWPVISFMVISNINTCIMNEAILSFLGLGLSIDTISWGSMLSLANRALLSNSWWVILFPGLFIVTTLFCLTNIIQYFQKITIHKHSNL